MDTGSLLSAYVLHTRRYRDSSLIVEMLSREQGRVSCVARGALRGRRGDGPLQPFVPLLVRLQGRGELQTLGSAETSGRPVELTGRRIFCGLYLNELLSYLTIRHDPCSGLFVDYQTALQALNEAPNEEPVLRRFELGMLRHLGHGPILDKDAAGQPIESGSRYTYDLEHGPVLTAADNPEAVRGLTLQALDRGEFTDAETLREARHLMRRILHHRLEGRPLRSRELFR